MACRMFGTKQLSEPMLVHCKWDIRENTWQFNWNTTIFVQEINLTIIVSVPM